MERIFRFVLLKRKAGTAHSAFSKHWSDTHFKVLMQAGLAEYNQSYMQNHFDRTLGAAALAEYDGCPQMLQPGTSTMAQGFQQDSRYHEIVKPDERIFLQSEEGVTLFAREHRVKEGVRTDRKLIVFAACGQSRTQAGFQAWVDQLAQDPAVGATHACRYDIVEQRTNVAVPKLDAIAEFYMDPALADRALAAIRDSWAKALDPVSSMIAVVTPRTYY